MYNDTKQVDIIKLNEYINSIEKNYPPVNYSMLREALDYCLETLNEQLNKLNDSVK